MNYTSLMGEENLILVNWYNHPVYVAINKNYWQKMPYFLIVFCFDMCALPGDGKKLFYYNLFWNNNTSHQKFHKNKAKQTSLCGWNIDLK